MLNWTQKTLKNAAAVAEKKNGSHRFLKDICVRGGCVIATDAHILYKAKNSFIKNVGLIDKENAKKGKPIFNDNNLIDFPEVDRCIPQRDALPYKVDVDRDDLLACAEAAKKFTTLQKISYITLMVHTEGGLTLKIGRLDQASITLNCASTNSGLDKAYIIHFSPSYLVTALRGFDKYDVLNIGFSKSNLRPFVINKSENNEQLYVITPMRPY